MRRRRHWAALLLFLSALLVVAYIWLVSYISDEIVAALDDEARQACACKFVVDDLDVSLLRLRGVATNARLISTEDNKPKLAFARLDASFGLERISERKVTIHNLRLSDGYALGFDEESVLYRFIDQLSADPPPGHVSTSLIKARLQSLQIVNARLEQQFSPELTLFADGVSMKMFRDDADDVHLEPLIKDFNLQTKSGPVKFGNVSGKVIIKDDNVEFNHIALARAREYLSASAQTIISQANKMQGELSFELDNDNFNLTSPKFKFAGSGSLAGHLAAPEIEIALNHSSERLIDISDKFPLIFNPIDLTFSLKLSHGEIDSKISKFSAASDSFQLDLSRPITLHQDKLDGAVKIVLQELSLGDLNLKGGNLIFTTSGSLGAPLFALDGTVAQLSNAGVSLTNISTHISSDLRVAKIKLGAAEERLKFSSNLHFDDLSIEHGQILARNLTTSDLGFTQILPAVLNLNASINGPLKSDKISMSGQGELVLADTTRLTLKTELASSKLELRLSDTSGQVNIETQTNIGADTDTALAANFNDFDLSVFGVPCGRITSHLNYKASAAEIMLGQGALSLAALRLGCGDVGFVLSRPAAASIDQGLLLIPELNLRSLASNVDLHGSVSEQKGYDLAFDVDLKLSELIQFIPQGDDLQGEIRVNTTVKGSFSKPIISGTGNLRSGELTIESSDLSITDTTADFSINGSDLHLTTLNGSANGGIFTMTGDVPLLDPTSARLQASFDEILIQTLPDTTIYFGGTLQTQIGMRGVPEVSGAVNISSAEYQRNIDLAAVVASVRKFFSRGRERAASQMSSGPDEKIPDIDLAVELNAARNVFVITNFAEAEFRAALKLSGSSRSPIFSGTVEALSMWFGLGDKRFEVNSAELRFRPDSFEPQLDMVSEGTFHARSGETTLVVLEAHGPLSAPRVTLSSDRGLSEQQILNLIATGYGSTGSNSPANVAGPIKGSSFYLLEDVPFLPFESLFRGLATIDSLTLEPRFNSQTAGLDPTVIATKDLGSRLTLLGESSFGGSASEARAKLRLDLSDRLNIAGILESATGRAHSSLGTDLTYTVLSGTRRFVEIEIKGNRHFSDRTLLRALRLGESSKLPQSESKQIKAALERFYRDQGYLDVRAEITCNAVGEFCRTLQIALFEGALFKLSDVQIRGDSLPVKVKLPSDINGEIASAEFTNSISGELLRQLRNEGYIRSRLKSSIQHEPATEQASLILELQHGTPVSFSFIGNKLFTPADFLDSINLFERRQPFGNNTINILVRNIATLYRSAGYFDAKIAWSQLSDTADERTNYRIEISEGIPARISAVKFNGLQVLSLEQLMQLIEALPEDQRRGLLHPKRALPEDLSSESELLRDLLVEHGFAQAGVSAHLSHVSDDEVFVNYEIHEGERVLGPRLVFHGLPSDLPAVAPLEPPYSAKRLNRVIDGAVESLTDAGYTQASLSSRSADDGSESLIIDVDAGVQTKIGEIIIEGLNSIPESNVRDVLPIKSGDAYTRAAIDASKRAILRLGLFSRVDIGALDSSVDAPTEDVKVKVIERSLQSLSVGIGANSELGLHLFAEGNDRSLFKDGRALSLRLDSYYDDLAGQISQGSANLQYLVPQVIGSDFAYAADGRFLKQQDLTLPYDLNRVSLANFLYRSWESGYTISAGHTVLGDDLSNVDSDSILGENDRGFVRLGFLTAAATLERRDDPLAPNSGYALNLETRVAANELGSEADFLSSNARATALLPISDTPWRFSLLGRGGAAWPFGATNEIPLSQRYFLGGRTSVRGYGENSLGPRGAQGSRIGGDVSLSDSVEAHYIFASSLYALTFVDSGNVFLRDGGVSLGDFRWSSGLGVRYVSPIGPIGFDIGVPINRESDEAAYRLHFNIGSGF